MTIEDIKMPLKYAWVKASQHKDWEVADMIEKIIRQVQDIEKELS
jgi:hypothetical protein